MISIEFQKYIAEYVLHKLEAIDPYCILAGGAPRDWYLGNVATDLDFYIYSKVPFCALEKQLRRVGLTEYSNVKTGDNLPVSYKLNPELRGVYNLLVDEDVPVQLMVMSDSTFKSVIPKFALNISQAWWKGGEIKTTKEFQIGLKHKVLYRTSDLYNNHHTYVEKIRDKFPDFEYYESRQLFLESLA